MATLAPPTSNVGNANGSDQAEHVSYILVAEFDEDTGSQLTHQYPYPTGADKQFLAEVMLPEGVHNRAEDWTVFFLNQNPSNTISPPFSRHSIDSSVSGASDLTAVAGMGGGLGGLGGAGLGGLGRGGEREKPELMYGLSLVRTKHDPGVKRKARFRAIAVCTYHPWIHIYKPVLSLALDQFYNDPSVDTLSRLFESINTSMDLSLMPRLSFVEKMILRASERNDCFAEKFLPAAQAQQQQHLQQQQQSLGRGEEDDGSDESLPAQLDPTLQGQSASAALAEYNRSRATSVTSVSVSDTSSRRSFDAQTTNTTATAVTAGTGGTGGTASTAAQKDWTTRHKRPSFDRVSSASSTNSNSRTNLGLQFGKTTSSEGHGHPLGNELKFRGAGTSGQGVGGVTGVGAIGLGTRDTHWFSTSIVFKGVTLPIRVPLAGVGDEVGDFSLIKLIQTFSSPTSQVLGPTHPHLHTNGPLTHPLILLFNALLTEKNVVFLGANRPAKDVVDYVLAACALASGGWLRGARERAYPYAPVAIRDVMETTTGYIAGVVNQIFESFPTWDILCNIDTGVITVNKNIRQPQYSPILVAPSAFVRMREREGDGDTDSLGGGVGGGAGGKSEGQGRADAADNAFMEDITSAIQAHYGESVIRMRMCDFILRFTRLASLYEQEAYGETQIGFRSANYGRGELGAGVGMLDDVARAREFTAGCQQRIEAWRRTTGYRYFAEDYRHFQQHRSIQGFDPLYQIHRLRTGKNVPESEVDVIMRSLRDSTQTYEQVTEILALLPPYSGGLMPITFCLFHPQQYIRDAAIDFLDAIQRQPIGKLFIQSLNLYHRLAYKRLVQTRNAQADVAKRNTVLAATAFGIPSAGMSLLGSTPSNQSQSSLVTS